MDIKQQHEQCSRLHAVPLRHVRALQRDCELDVHGIHADDVSRCVLGGHLNVKVRSVWAERVESDWVYSRFSLRMRYKLLRRWHTLCILQLWDEPCWIHLRCSVHV